MNLIVQQSNRHQRAVARIGSIAAKLKRKSRLLSLLRLLSFAAAVAMPPLLWRTLPTLDSALLYSSALPGTVIFLIAVIWQSRLRQRLRRAGEAVRLHEESLELLAGRWPRDRHSLTTPIKPENDEGYRDDLQIDGPFSLFAQRCRSLTPRGERRLEQLLTCQPDPIAADPKRWKARQNGVRELSRRRVLRLRLRLALFDALGSGTKHDLDTPKSQLSHNTFAATIESALAFPTPLLVWVARILPPITLLFFFGYYGGYLDPWHLLTFPLHFFIYLLTLWIYRPLQQLSDLSAPCDAAARLLRTLRGYSFDSPHLSELRISDESTTIELSRFATLLSWLEIRRNPILHLIVGITTFHELHILATLEPMARDIDRRLDEALDELAELDALLSLADYSAEQRNESWPELLAGDSSHLIEAEGVAHPLIPIDSRVANSFIFGNDSRMWLVTGSNMAGKSTFLRTTGISLLLAMAGSSVAADRFAFRPLRLATSIRLGDDMSRSISHFYAEVRRMRHIFTLAEEQSASAGLPLFFLIDEIFQGTNQRERLIAARSLLMQLLDLGACGMVTSHDLELTDLGRQSRVELWHFTETIRDGAMFFDYTLHPGPVEAGNALRILELEGLKIDHPGES